MIIPPYDIYESNLDDINITNKNKRDNTYYENIEEIINNYRVGRVCCFPHFFITFVCIKLNHEICYGKETLLR